MERSATGAAAMAGTHFADWGAGVIRLESLQRPDGYRLADSPAADGPDFWEQGVLWLDTNANKRSLTLDLTSLGEHNDELLTELLGRTPEQIGELEGAGLIGTVPQGLE